MIGSSAGRAGAGVAADCGVVSTPAAVMMGATAGAVPGVGAGLDAGRDAASAANWARNASLLSGSLTLYTADINLTPSATDISALNDVNRAEGNKFGAVALSNKKAAGTSAWQEMVPTYSWTIGEKYVTEALLCFHSSLEIDLGVVVGQYFVELFIARG